VNYIGTVLNDWEPSAGYTGYYGPVGKQNIYHRYFRDE
jgi:hypothetical protein